MTLVWMSRLPSTWMFSFSGLFAGGGEILR